ncbi:gluconate 2-dehydrogenase subunit 3 family protein [Parahaliea aestuarii]|nr:gluconate 2-dehydrogenase subunit 3 family protein [Parahaliea aestuarii]
MGANPLALATAQQTPLPTVLKPDEWTALEALCGILLPPVNGVSTRDAGVANFIDKFLLHEGADQLPIYRRGLHLGNAYALTIGTPSWSALGEGEQVRWVEQLEDGALSGMAGPEQQVLFQSLWFNTLLGFLAAPSHGGNVNHAGWRAISFPGHLHMQGGITDDEVAGKPAE